MLLLLWSRCHLSQVFPFKFDIDAHIMFEHTYIKIVKRIWKYKKNAGKVAQISQLMGERKYSWQWRHFFFLFVIFTLQSLYFYIKLISLRTLLHLLWNSIRWEVINGHKMKRHRMIFVFDSLLIAVSVGMNEWMQKKCASKKKKE